MKLTMLLR